MSKNNSPSSDFFVTSETILDKLQNIHGIFSIGIGRVTALKLASLGAEVYGISRTAENLASLKKECPSINTICQDIGDWNGTRAAVEKLPVMDGLVNNAGINTQQSFLEVTEEKLDR